MSTGSDKYDFFVSYARKDNQQEWVSEFVNALLEEHRKFTGGKELVPFFDKNDIHTGNDFQIHLAHGIAQSRLFLAFISPNYFASEWCRKEWQTWIDIEISKHILSEGAKPIYLVEVPGFLGSPAMDENEVSEKILELCSISEQESTVIQAISPVIKQLRRRQVLSNFTVPFRNQGLDALRRKDLQKMLEELAKDLDEKVMLARLAAESANTVPPYNKKFTGRLDELLLLRERLKDDRSGVICGIHGLGGIGKTELAFTYAHAFASAYPGGRFYIPCEGKVNLKDAVLKLGDESIFYDQINDEERKLDETFFNAITRCLTKRLEEKGHILLVLDNVTDKNFLSRQQTDSLTALGPKLHLLATTRNIPPAGGAWHTLGELPETDAIALFEKHRQFDNEEERKAAKQIVKQLGGFAMAIELVAAWLAVHSGSNYSQFLEGLELKDLEDIAGDSDVELRRHNHEKRLTAVLGPVLDSLKPVERKIIEYTAFLPPDNIALPWLKELIEKDFPCELIPTKLIAAPWKDIWKRLLSLALISRADGETYEPIIVRTHRLIQKLIKESFDAEKIENYSNIIEKYIKNRCTILENETNWQNARWELDPLNALAWLWGEVKHKRASWLLNSVGLHWLDLAVWNSSEFAFRRALEIDLEDYTSEHPNVARDLNNLSLLLKATNRLKEAEPLMRRALEIDEQSLGPDHPTVAIRLNNLALLLMKTSRLREAEPLMRRALEIDEQSFGSNHTNIAIRLSNLAQLLQLKKRLREAEALMRRALEIDEQNFGPDHPNIIIDLNNLAGLLQDTKRLREAEPLMRRALEIDEQSFGVKHTTVARDLNNLALLLKATNRRKEAEPLMKRALEILLLFSFSAKMKHPHINTLLTNYCFLLKGMGFRKKQIKEKLNELGKNCGIRFRYSLILGWAATSVSFDNHI